MKDVTVWMLLLVWLTQIINPIGCCVGLHQKSKFVYKYPIGCCVGLHQKSKFVHKYPENYFQLRPKIVSIYLSIYLFTFFIFIHCIRSYLQTWRDHSMRSIVLPWYHGGHVLSKMQCRQLYLQDGKGSQKGKKKKKKKNMA